MFSMRRPGIHFGIGSAWAGTPSPASATCMRMPLAWTKRCRIAAGGRGPGPDGLLTSRRFIGGPTGAR
jgi:hypothetical protein